MKRRAVALSAFCLLAACSATPTVRATSAGAEGVTYEFPADRQGDALRQAMLYCANLGRGAVLKDNRLEPDGLAVAAYECR